MKTIYFAIFLFSLKVFAEYNNINIYKEVHYLYYKKQYDKALFKAQEFIKKVDDNPNLGDLADLYLRLYEKHPVKGIQPIKFLINQAKRKKDYITKERIILAVAVFLQKHEEYEDALKFYAWIERNHNEKSLVYDDALWNSFLIYKNLNKNKQALKYLNKIIATHQYSIYVGTYNQYHLYDAYIEKADILLKLKKKSEAIKTLKNFTENFSLNDKVDDAYFKLCKLDNKKYCCDLIKKYKYSSYFNKASDLCNEKNN